eukprot:5841172-Prymnesium_polylepis.1
MGESPRADRKRRHQQCRGGDARCHEQARVDNVVGEVPNENGACCLEVVRQSCQALRGEDEFDPHQADVQRRTKQSRAADGQTDGLDDEVVGVVVVPHSEDEPSDAVDEKEDAAEPGKHAGGDGEPVAPEHRYSNQCVGSEHEA